MRALPRPPRIRLAIVSPCPPRACPIGAYVDELTRMLRIVAPEIALSLWAVTDDVCRPVAGGLPACGTIPVDDPSAYRRAALDLHRLGADVVLLQFGAGAAGGPHGRYLLGFTDELDRLHVPYLVTLHDLRRAMRPDDADMAAALSRKAAGIIVLSESARAALVHNRLAVPGRIAVVTQGAPPELIRPEMIDPASEIAQALAGSGGGPVLTTIGHLRPAKGIEIGLTALPLIAARHPGVRYVVAGRTHDRQKRLAGEWYREALVRTAENLGVADRLVLVDADPTPAELSTLLRITDVYLATDLDRGRTSAGSLSYALAAGRPVVATANPFAHEVVPPRGGRVVASGDPAAVAAAAEQLLDDPPHRPPLWPSSLAMAGQIAGLIHLISGPPTRRVDAAAGRPAARRGSPVLTRGRSA